ncbi:glycosyltransferase [Desulfobacterota bacterium AH_259_B03_O07]|nr:glycosyltransferase [Desulfobacterota bacterium AH_259_B03_O07]
MTLEILKRLDRNHFNPILVCLEDLGPLITELPSDIIFYTLRGKKAKDYFSKIDLFGIIKLQRLIRKHRIRIVQTHLRPASLVGSVSAILGRVPILIDTYHDMYEPTSSRYLRFVDKLLLQFINQIVCVSFAVKDSVLSAPHIPSEKITIIYNGIDLQRFQPIKPVLQVKDKLEIKRDDKVVGLVGRLVPEKGIEDLLYIAPKVIAAVPGVKFVIVGDGPLKMKLEYMASKFGLASYFRFIGTRRDMPALYSNFDIYLHLASKEGFGISLVEAMAMGCPVIATRVGSIPEITGNGNNCVLVHLGDTDSLIRQIVRLLTMPSLAYQLRKAATNRAKIFDIKNTINGLQNLYLSLLREQ